MLLSFAKNKNDRIPKLTELVKEKYSLVLLVLMLGFILIYGINTGNYKDRRIIQNDVISYYAYLPASLIYRDLGFGFVDDLKNNPEVRIWTHQSPTGEPVLKMTMGVAILNAPFFILAHVFSKILGYEANGYSTLYEFFILLASIVYLFAGLLALRKILMKFFSQAITMMTLVTLVFATNLFYYTCVEPGMPHVYGFFLTALCLRATLSFFDKSSLKWAFLFGLIAGLLILVRPSNIVVLIIPALFGFKYLKREFIKPLLLATLVMVVVLIPQLVYWKVYSGQWLYYSYGDEGFYFFDPALFKGLLSYRKGWLVYTPVLVFSLVGLMVMHRKVQGFKWPVILYLVLNTYVVFSWWCWWYGGGFGARPLIESYAVLSLPLGAFLDYSFRRLKKSYFILIPLFCFFIFLNLFQTRQYRTTQLHWDSTSKELYWKVFLTNDWPENYQVLLDPPDYDAAKYRRK